MSTAGQRLQRLLRGSMPILPRETVEGDLARLRAASLGSSYWRVDLHTHSPGSEDSRWPTGTTPHDFVAAYAQRGVALVAVTDHSTGAWIDQLKEAARKYTQRHKTPFALLPGVELNANGIHITAIFPETATSASIALLLGRLGLQESDFGKEATCVFKTVSEIAAEVHKEGGLLVGAHCNSSNGVVEGLEGNPRENALHSLTFLEIRADQATAKIRKTITYVADALGFPSTPFVFSSDAHGPEEFIENVSLIKMHFPSFAGLRQLQFEPHLRTSGTSQPHSTKAYITGIVLDNGLYEDAAIRFNSDLNVIIGGRGAGKSALVDIIRFCLGHEAIASSYQEVVNQRLAGFLSPGDEARLYVSLDGTEYCVRRRMESSRLRDSVLISSTPELYRLRESGPIREAHSPADLLPIDIYGQGEVMEITKKADDQLALIDSFTDLASITAQLQAQRERLQRANGERLQQTEKRVALLEEVAAKTALSVRISEIDEHLQDPVFAEHQAWEDQKLYVQDVDGLLEEITELVPSDPYSDLDLPELPDDTPTPSPLRQIRSSLKTLLRQLNTSVERGNTSLQETTQTVSKLKGEWEEHYRNARAGLQARLKKLKLSDIANVHAERNELRGKLNKIERQYEPGLKRIDDKLSSLSRERDTALDRINSILEQRTRIRQATAEYLNSHLPANVRVRIIPLADESEYFDLLNSTILAGLGIRNREKHVQSLVTAFKPRDLARLIRQNSEEPLTAAGLSEDACAKVLALLEDQIERIEESPLEDRPVVELMREGHTDFSALDQLSIGEKCSVILALLLSSQERPLVIDEPEAELDHEFICSSVVQSIRSAKGNRQVLVCTHNPNIPVLGDAELVIKVAKVPGQAHCIVEHSAGFEHERSIHYLKQLEGGEAALRMRSSKYHLDLAQ